MQCQIYQSTIEQGSLEGNLEVKSRSCQLKKAMSHLASHEHLFTLGSWPFTQLIWFRQWLEMIGDLHHDSNWSCTRHRLILMISSRNSGESRCILISSLSCSTDCYMCHSDRDHVHMSFGTRIVYDDLSLPDVQRTVIAFPLDNRRLYGLGHPRQYRRYGAQSEKFIDSDWGSGFLAQQRVSGLTNLRR